MEKWDVVIAGAGPAGAHCARFLRMNSDLSVLLLDRTKRLGCPKKSTAGVPAQTMERFGLPSKLAQQDIRRLIFESPDETAEIPIEAKVLDFSKLKKFLLEDAKAGGAKVMIGEEATEPILDGKSIVGVRVSRISGDEEFRAKIVIDATGPGGVLAKSLGLVRPAKKHHWIGMEHEMDRLSLGFNDAMCIRFDNRYAPGGYSWIFSTGKDTAKVGNCWSLGQQAGGCSLKSHLEKWIASDHRLRSGIRLETHGGDAYLDCPHGLSGGGFMTIGDAARTINPLFGEGIRQAMFSAELAGKVVIDSLNSGETGARRLKEYDLLWKRTIWSRSSRICRFIAKRLYSLSNEQFNSVVRRFKRLPDTFLPSDFQRFLDYDVTLNDLKKFRSL